MAIPQQTASVTMAVAPAVITQGPELWCPNGQTAVYTTDCTMGTPVSYCFSPEPPIECSQGFFPLSAEANLNLLSCSCLLLLSRIPMVQHDPTTRLVEI
ncbi:hypothetical protein ACN38_g2963 [Penicillium nordicum]|uniref:Uncharacterized protein n=1 Tax=Penicillium nordicum TaxID=229535 RepID=A0A0M9WIF9_9EURO|nr:hypothetical protein ACN38_g2963 [Penicillium nordicum]